MKSIYWIRNDKKIGLAIAARPRGEDWLGDDLCQLKNSGIHILVSLLESDEAASLGLSQEAKLADENEMEFISFPIPDRTVPVDRQGFCRIITYLAEAIRNGKNVAAHCRGCIGRATITTASILIELGFAPETALQAIEEARGCSVPDTEEQKHWIMQWSPCSGA